MQNRTFKELVDSHGLIISPVEIRILKSRGVEITGNGGDLVLSYGDFFLCKSIPGASIGKVLRDNLNEIEPWVAETAEYESDLSDDEFGIFLNEKNAASMLRAILDDFNGLRSLDMNLVDLLEKIGLYGEYENGHIAIYSDIDKNHKLMLADPERTLIENIHEELETLENAIAETKGLFSVFPKNRRELIRTADVLRTIEKSIQKYDLEIDAKIKSGEIKRPQTLLLKDSMLSRCTEGITHAGTFHADDVFSAAFLKILNPNIKITRVNEVPEEIPDTTIVFDIGGGKYDHHQKDNEVRDVLVRDRISGETLMEKNRDTGEIQEKHAEYAAFGKLWREFSPLTLLSEESRASIEKELVMPIDLQDNNGFKPNFGNTLSMMIKEMNPLWHSAKGSGNEQENPDRQFEKAVEFASTILTAVIDNYRIRENAPYHYHGGPEPLDGSIDKTKETAWEILENMIKKKAEGAPQYISGNTLTEMITSNAENLGIPEKYVSMVTDSFTRPMEKVNEKHARINDVLSKTLNVLDDKTRSKLIEEVLERKISVAKAAAEPEKALEKLISENGVHDRILISKAEYIPDGSLKVRNDIDFFITPDARSDGYTIHTEYDKKSGKTLPREWCGARPDSPEMQHFGLNFCHTGGFLATAKTLEQAVYAAKIAGICNEFGISTAEAEKYISKEERNMNDIEKPSVLWFSSHEMTDEQREALGDVGQIDQISRQIQSAYELKDEIKNHDIIAIAAPINLQQQFLKLAEDKPVIMAKSDRILTKDENGREEKVAFKFNKWEQIKNISVKLEDFQPADDKKVLWVSRHGMEPAQLEALGENPEVTQVSRTLKNAYELQNEIKEADVIAIVAPVNIQQQFLKLAGDKPVIIAKMDRTDEIIPETGEKTVKMSFNKWEQIKSIDIDIADFELIPEAKEIEQEQELGEAETRYEKEDSEAPKPQELPEEEEELEEEEEPGDDDMER